MKSIRELEHDYYAWLKEETGLRSLGKWTEITSPYLDRHNDYIQIYIKKLRKDIS